MTESKSRTIKEVTFSRNVRGKKTRNPGWEPGNHWVQCDRCACVIRSKDSMITWDNLVVCPDDWEIRHPQDFVRGRSDDTAAKFPVRPESEDSFVNSTCYETSSIPGEMIPGCALPGVEVNGFIVQNEIPQGTFGPPL